MSRPLQTGDLHLVRDKPAVYAWLRAFLRWHLASFSRSAGLPWTDAQIDERIDRGGLLEREWQSLSAASQADDHLVAVVRAGTRAVGIVHATEQQDRYLGLRLGVLAWIFVEPVSRGSGAGDLLMEAAHDWMKQRGLAAVELFVTADNAPAMALYRRHGYAIADHRMIARLDRSDRS
jgi:ribosomal protein S18 acetylase RimI-like enzyme